MICVLFLICFTVLVESDVRADTIVTTLQKNYYNTETGLWKNIGWWNSANSLESLTLYMIYSSSNTFMDDIQNTFSRTSVPETETGSFDDAQWWAIAWFRNYQLTKNPQYLQRSIDIWNYILSNAWDNTCNGGVWWSSSKNYKNAITNELFLVLSTLLYLENPTNSTYKDWAIAEWNWFEASGMINSNNLVNDGLSNCKNNGGTTWTYNQGVILGGLYYLYQITGNSTLLSVAQNIASATITKLVYSDDVLKETCEPNNCDGDQHQFKGIFLRYFGILTEGMPNNSNKSMYKAWIQTNSDSIWSKDRNPSTNTCGLVWNGPNDQSAEGITQTSALDCFNAAMLVNSK